MSQYQNQMSAANGYDRNYASDPQLGHFSPNFHNLPSFSGISSARHLVVIIENHKNPDFYRSTRKCSSRISRWYPNGTATDDGMASKWSFMFLSNGDSCDSSKLPSKSSTRNHFIFFSRLLQSASSSVIHGPSRSKIKMKRIKISAICLLIMVFKWLPKDMIKVKKCFNVRHLSGAQTTYGLLATRMDEKDQINVHFHSIGPFTFDLTR